VRPDTIANGVRFFAGRRGIGPSNANTTFAWDFGDGSTSTDPRTSHTYATPGVYYVCLTVTKTTAGGTCTDTWCDSVNTNFPPRHPRHPRLASDMSSEISAEAAVSIFPNPMVESSTIRIENTSGNVTLNVYNMTGQIAFTKQLSNGDFIIGKENLTEGLYFYDVVDGNNSVAKGKLIVN
jgi:PKD repeat protein